MRQRKHRPVLCALAALEHVKDSERVLPIVRNVLSSADENVRLAALELLSRRAADLNDMAELVRQALRDEKEQVRLAAIRVLRECECEGGEDLLIECLHHEETGQVLYEIARALGWKQAVRAKEWFLRYLQRDSPAPLVVLGCLDALTRVGDDECVDTCERYLRHPDPDIADAAAAALIEISSRRQREDESPARCICGDYTSSRVE